MSETTKIEQPGLKIERRIEGLPYPLWWEHMKGDHTLRLYSMLEDGHLSVYGIVNLADDDGFVASRGKRSLFGQDHTFDKLANAMDHIEAYAVDIYEEFVRRERTEEKIVDGHMTEVEVEMKERRA